MVPLTQLLIQPYLNLQSPRMISNNSSLSSHWKLIKFQWGSFLSTLHEFRSLKDLFVSDLYISSALDTNSSLDLQVMYKSLTLRHILWNRTILLFSLYQCRLHWIDCLRRSWRLFSLKSLAIWFHKSSKFSSIAWIELFNHAKISCRSSSSVHCKCMLPLAIAPSGSIFLHESGLCLYWLNAMLFIEGWHLVSQSPRLLCCRCMDLFPRWSSQAIELVLGRIARYCMAVILHVHGVIPLVKACRQFYRPFHPWEIIAFYTIYWNKEKYTYFISWNNLFQWLDKNQSLKR